METDQISIAQRYETFEDFSHAVAPHSGREDVVAELLLTEAQLIAWRELLLDQWWDPNPIIRRSALEISTVRRV